VGRWEAQAGETTRAGFDSVGTAMLKSA
jgi:hypothetical protein